MSDPLRHIIAEIARQIEQGSVVLAAKVSVGPYLTATGRPQFAVFLDPGGRLVTESTDAEHAARTFVKYAGAGWAKSWFRRQQYHTAFPLGDLVDHAHPRCNPTKGDRRGCVSAPRQAAYMSPAEKFAADRVPWSSMTIPQIEAAHAEALRYNDPILARKAKAALARRGY